ncbi:hypothetical protein GCM10010193_02760 [Kitasatospora atroaurantiaca]|uniref:Small secreted domain DUF320 n=1 Tax=Kitasatospora atroaurantiaca TaxID=285545 RepID=A0A561ELK0_9ACTN|nr:hypothetical protein [Kitasatospora atroaurantiaca]TWE16497.1 hypothetical protein FB465_1479 [Kitasatospora atroaurantiaca]
MTTVRKALTARNGLLLAAAVCGLMFGTAGSAAATCSALDVVGGLAPGFGNSCVSR